MRLPFSKWTGLIALFCVGLLLYAGATLWRQGFAQSPAQSPIVGSPALTPLPQDPSIQVYFNHAASASYTEPYRHQTRLGDDLEQRVVEAIATAQTSIDVAVHELTLPQIAQALAKQQQAGITVRVIVEHTYARPLSQVTASEAAHLEARQRQKYLDFVQLADRNQDGQVSLAESNVSDAIIILKNAHIPILDDTADGSKGSDLMHHKFVIIDRKILIVGSSNFTPSDVHGDISAPQSLGNANHLLKIESAALAKLFTQEFNLMWGDGVGHRTNSLFGLKKPYRPPQTVTIAPHSTITVQFSPTPARWPWEQSVNGLIGRSLQASTQSIDLALFVFSDQALSNQLETLHQKGIRIRALIDSGFIERDYSEALDMMGVSLADHRCRYESGNHPWNPPLTAVGTPNLPKGDLLHHKFAVIDHRTVITGSHNWSAAANRGNDENLLVIQNSTVAAHFQREFDRLYDHASLGISNRLQKKIKQQRSRCHR